MINMVDYYRAGNEAPRIAAGIKVLEEIKPGQMFGPQSLREHVMQRCDLAEKTVRNLIHDALYCEKPILRKFGERTGTRYVRAAIDE